MGDRGCYYVCGYRVYDRGQIQSQTGSIYWFGLSTGVVDIRVPNIPYQTKKLLTFFRDSIVNGNYDPFAGELRTQAEGKSRILTETEFKDTESDILSIKWLNENIDGSLPVQK